MSDARGRDAWQHTTSMLALMINQNRHSKRDRKVHPDELNPYINRTARKNDNVIHDPGNMQILKKVFVKDATKSSNSLTADGKFEETKQKLQNAAPKIEAASSAVGTFSAAFAGRLTGGTAAARTADAIEKLLDEQRRHNKIAEKSGKVMKFVATGPATPLEM